MTEHRPLHLVKMWFLSLTCKPGSPISIILQVRELRLNAGRYLFFLTKYFFSVCYFVCLSIWSACTYVYHMCTTCEVKARREHWILLELVLEMVLSCYVSAGNRTWDLCKSSKCSKPQNRLSSPSIILSKNRRWESST